MIIISTQFHHTHISQFASMHGDNSSTPIHSSIQVAHIFINNMYLKHSIKHTFHHNKHTAQQEHIAQFP